MNAFLLGILSSLVTSALLLGLSLLRASRPLWWLTAACSWFTGTGLRRVYRRQASAEHHMRRDLARAQWVKVMAGRGNILTREAFAPLWSETSRPHPCRSCFPTRTHRTTPGSTADPRTWPASIRASPLTCSEARSEPTSTTSPKPRKHDAASGCAATTSPHMPHHRHRQGRLPHLLQRRRPRQKFTLPVRTSPGSPSTPSPSSNSTPPGRTARKPPSGSTPNITAAAPPLTRHPRAAGERTADAHLHCAGPARGGRGVPRQPTRSAPQIKSGHAPGRTFQHPP